MAEVKAYNTLMNPILRATNLVKKFGNMVAVNNISFSIMEGEIVGLLGPNGAGKTTTIQMLLGLLLPTHGEITIFGQNLELHRQEILQQINFSSAYINFPSRLTVEENLKIYARLYDLPDINECANWVMQMLNITDLAKQQYLYLSTGQQTRVHLAKAFINHPRILFLDEPTAALDPDIADSLRDLIIDLQKKENLTVFLTSHNMAEVEEVCDRVLFIDHGQVIVEDSPENLAGRITRTTVRLMIKDGLKRTLLFCQKQGFEAAVEGRYLEVNLIEDDIVYFLTFLVEKGISYQEISIDRPTLEDFFLEQARKKT
jgi:ABC-2 type transport system ATP-binding protein